MSDDNKQVIELAIRQVEREQGRRLSEQEREEFAQLRSNSKQYSEWFCREMIRTIEAQHEAYEKSPFVTFMRTLQARQGTFVPDFDALYRRKAELDDDPRT